MLLALRCTLTCHVPGLPSLGPAPSGKKVLAFLRPTLLLSHKASVSRLHCRQSEVATRALDLGSGRLCFVAMLPWTGAAGRLPILRREPVGLTGRGRAGVAKEERSRISRFSLC